MKRRLFLLGITVLPFLNLCKKAEGEDLRTFFKLDKFPKNGHIDALKGEVVNMSDLGYCNPFLVLDFDNQGLAHVTHYAVRDNRPLAYYKGHRSISCTVSTLKSPIVVQQSNNSIKMK